MAKSKVEQWLTPEGLTLLRGWAREGLTDDDIAKKCNIVRSTLSEWKKKYSDISDALKKGKEIADYGVEDSLFKNACGYDYLEEIVSTKKEVIYHEGKRVKEISEPVVVLIKKHKPGETAAQIYWLKNRKSNIWRDKPADTTNDTEGVIIINDLPK